MTEDEIRQDVISACEWAKASGIELVSGMYGDGVTHACPLTAVAARDKLPNPGLGEGFSHAVKKYGWDNHEVLAFTRSYDEVFHDETFQSQLGTAVRKLFLQGDEA